MELNYQKTYRGLSAYGWLKKAEIIATLAGTAEIAITTDGLIQYHINQDDDGDMVLCDVDGSKVGIICTTRASAMLDSLVELRDKKQVTILKKADKAGGTTYAESL